MPEQQRQDNEQTRRWMRQLERERLDALSIAEGEGLPGPGAVESSTHRPTPRSASEDPRQWRRQLERDRLSMAAMSESPAYPGPGAVGTPDAAQAAAAGGAAAAMADVTKSVQGIMPKVSTRGSLWAGVASVVAGDIGFIVPLILLPFHKIWYDGKIKDVAVKIKSNVIQYKIPLPPQAQLLVRIAPLLPTIEWIVLMALYGLAGFLCLAILALLGVAVCAQSLSCISEMGPEAIKFFLGFI